MDTNEQRAMLATARKTLKDWEGICADSPKPLRGSEHIQARAAAEIVQAEVLIEIAALLRVIADQVGQRQPVNVSVSTGWRLRLGRRRFGRVARMGMSTRGGIGRGGLRGAAASDRKEC